MCEFLTAEHRLGSPAPISRAGFRLRLSEGIYEKSGAKRNCSSSGQINLVKWGCTRKQRRERQRMGKRERKNGWQAGKLAPLLTQHHWGLSSLLRECKHASPFTAFPVPLHARILPEKHASITPFSHSALLYFHTALVSIIFCSVSVALRLSVDFTAAWVHALKLQVIHQQQLKSSLALFNMFYTWSVINGN